jgi:hypothetical protein
MKPRLLVPFLIMASASATFGQTPAFSYCGTYGAYVMLYKNTDQFEELGKLRCAEKVEVLGRWFDYLEVRTVDGKVGWVRSADVSGGPGVSPSATPFGLTNSPEQQQHPAVVPLSNKNILTMQAIKLGPDVIIAKIKSSPTNFDTSAEGLQKLKRAGVSDKIILAMVEAQATPAPNIATSVPAPPKAPEVLQIKIPDGTPVEVELIASVSSDAVREGTILHLKVAKDVALNGVTVFQKDAEARARVYVVTQPAFLGKPGQISWAMEDITAINGDQLPATFASEESSAANASTTNVEDTGTTWEFRKNKPTTMPAGHHMRATIHGDIVLKIPATLAAQTAQSIPDPSKSAPAPVQASPEVSSKASAAQNQKPQ